MFSHDAASADSRQTDFLSVTLLARLAPVIYIVVLVVHSLIQAVCQCQRCPAGRVYLLVVMLLYNLHIKAGTGQNLCGLLHQLQKRIDTQRHIGRAKHCCALGSLRHLCKLLFAKPCGAQNQRQLLSRTVGQDSFRGFGGRKIDHGIRLHITVIYIREHRISVVTVIYKVNACHNLCLRVILHKSGYDLTHMAVAAAHNYSDHLFFLFRNDFTGLHSYRLFTNRIWFGLCQLQTKLYHFLFQFFLVGLLHLSQR